MGFIEIFQTELPSAFVAQNVRGLAVGLSQADIAITSDIDMLPLHPRAMDTALREVFVGSRRFVVVRDVLDPGQLAICYNVATPQTWTDITGVSDEVSMRKMLDEVWSTISSEGGYDGTRGGQGWFADQEFLWSWVEAYGSKQPGQVIRLKDAGTKHRRLDRIFFRGKLRWLQLLGVALGRYTDYHMHLPVGENKIFLEAVARFRSVASRSRFTRVRERN